MTALNRFLKASKLLVATIVVGVSATAANAGYITLVPAGLQLIYDQANIQIRYNAAQTIYNTALLQIDDDAEFSSLADFAVGGKTLSMFFVDGINFCGSPVPGIVGCGSTPGNLIALDSGFVFSEVLGAAPTAMGHEIGHNLGLGHLDPADPDVPDNLMNPFTYNGNPAPLTQAQIDQIYLSPLIQFDGNQAFLSVTPFAVAAFLVPEPGSFALVGLAMGLLAWHSRRARRG